MVGVGGLGCATDRPGRLGARPSGYVGICCELDDGARAAPDFRFLRGGIGVIAACERAVEVADPGEWVEESKEAAGSRVRGVHRLVAPVAFPESRRVLERTLLVGEGQAGVHEGEVLQV